ncbi:MAG: heme lyase CcmF/NrfE family subunit [Phycisphaerales bacterium]
MIEPIGTYSLSLAVVAAAGGVLAAIMAFRFDSHPALVWARRLTLIGAGLITLACAALTAAIINDHFEFTYVANYSERALPIGYKIAAFWAGQAGSLLLWAWILAAMTAVLIHQHRRAEKNGAVAVLGERAIALAVMAAVNAFFAGLILFAANPFITQLLPGAADGHGLNPMLQDPGMIAHPPTLFIGYAGFTVPFAMLIGALAAGRKDDSWILATRKWLLFAWLFLSVGIVLGAQWAYIELGWGGYWAWDPVENASLLPWLTGTALLHSIMVQQYRKSFRLWNASLIAGTFLLCIFGTYLTRSGVIQSVHTFPESPIGRFFLAFMAVCFVVTVILIVARRTYRLSDTALEIGFNREGAFLATNVLLVLMTATVLVGTIYPLISVFFTGQPISVGPPFYNKAVLPMALVLLAMMAMGPALSYGPSDAKRLLARLRLPLAGAGVSLGVALTMGLREPWSLAVTAIAVLGIVNVFNDMIVTWWKIVRVTNNRSPSPLQGEGWGEGQSLEGAASRRSSPSPNLSPTWWRGVRGSHPVTMMTRMIDDNHRRYGGQLVHLGMMMVMAGVAGSSLFNEKTTVQLKPGESAQFAEYTMTLEKLDEQRRGNYTAVQATVHLANKAGVTDTLLPEVRYYDKAEQPNTQVALQMGLKRDLYVTLAGWEQNGSVVAIQAIINPLVSWIWIGGIVLAVGTIFAMTPKLLQPRPQPQTIPASQTEFATGK